MVSIFFLFFCPYLIHPHLCMRVRLLLSLCQGEIGIPGEQGEIGFKGDKVCHLCNTVVHATHAHALYLPAFLSHRMERYLQYTCDTQPLSLQNDFSRCLLFSLRKFICSPSTFVSVCKQNSNPSQSRVAPRDSTILNRESCMSNVCFARKEIKLLILSDCLSEFVTFVCIGQGVQGAPGLPGIRGKPGPQVSSCLGMYSWKPRIHLTVKMWISN